MLKATTADQENGLDRDIPIAVATMPASQSQRRAAVITVFCLLLAAVSIAPFAKVQLPRIDAFIPVLQTVLSTADFLTATILFAQYSFQPQRGLLIVGIAYLFSGSFAFLQTLAFPNGYAPSGVIGDGFNSPAWFFVLWHTTFPLTILAYALLKDSSPSPSAHGEKAGQRILLAVLCTFVVIAFAAWIVTTGVAHLPSFYAGSIVEQTRLGNQVNVALWLLGVTVMVILFVRRRTILDLWLIVTLLAWTPNFLAAAAANSIRFSLGWYAGRGFALVASCTLLCVLLTEMTVLYSRLASALILQRRERVNRLMSIDAATAAIAHEVRQPLSSIALNASTAISQVRETPPDLDDLDIMLEEIEAASHRAGAVITSVRQLFGTRSEDRSAVDVNKIAEQAVVLLQHELHLNEVRTSTDFAADLPQVAGDATQLQQVVLNLVKNAIDAMQARPANARLLQMATRRSGATSIVLSLSDSGPGISKESQSRIFDPFFSTKPTGMGLGLAICRSIVENHGGGLRLAESSAMGSTFEMTLSVDQRT
ncbi:MASE4 domain-containing protein [Bradyrhizobium sp. A11]|uniref:MASE4 domain-containing protein n=1 Tax=Bradyrhizobium sp. A11 TaxID=3133974 RepID=UPI003246E279